MVLALPDQMGFAELMLSRANASCSLDVAASLSGHGEGIRSHSAAEGSRCCHPTCRGIFLVVLVEKESRESIEKWGELG